MADLFIILSLNSEINVLIKSYSFLNSRNNNNKFVYNS